MRKTKIFLEAVIVISVVLALILPSSAVITNTSSEVETDPFFDGKIKREIKETKTWDPIKSPLKLTMGENIQISGWAAEGDDIRPAITKTDDGKVFVTYQHDEGILTSSMGFAWNDNPSDQEAWFENGVILSLEGIEQIYYPDTATCEHPDYPLMNVFVTADTEEAGGMYIPDPTDYETWEIYTWTSGSPEPEFAGISDGGWYQDQNYEDVIGPFNFYIERSDLCGDLPGCPVFFHTGIDAASGVGYYDCQEYQKTAPAADPDYVNLPNKIHTSIYNKDTGKVIWKKIDPAVECDYEYTPYQATVADGTNPSIGAYDNNVAIVYSHAGNIKCVYSSNDGETWSQPLTIGPGGFPDVFAVGSALYAAYVNNGNLYVVSSKNGGATWSSPEKKNDQDGTVVAQENCIDMHSAGIVWVDNRNGANNIYYTPVGSPPNTPTISGPPNGKPNKEYDFTVTTTDPNGGQVWYWIDWNDTTNTGWLGPFTSGTGTTVTHKYTTKEAFVIKAKAKNADGLESGWAELQFSTPKTTSKYRSLFYNFLARFPFLQHIFGL